MESSPPAAEAIVALLGLRPLPREGGFYAETFRGEPLSADGSGGSGGPAGSEAADERVIKTAIYYLMTPHAFSALHRLPSPELFHFYLGDPVEQLLLFPDGTGRLVRLGDDLLAGERPQSLVPGGVWQGARLAPGGRTGYSLLGTTMAPGFAFSSYEHGERGALLAAYPAFAAGIVGLTRSEADAADEV
ncbi:MAG: cupin domain-containing protein [Chloroflexia bacterium]|nr:cupin domain-containing protein [Chloroflexia bacterium]